MYTQLKLNFGNEINIYIPAVLAAQADLVNQLYPEHTSTLRVLSQSNVTIYRSYNYHLMEQQVVEFTQK